LKCVQAQNGTKEGNTSKQRKILDDASTSGDTKSKSGGTKSTSGGTKSTSGGPKHYTTYRSCVPLEGEEKLSFLGFEVLLKLQKFSFTSTEIAGLSVMFFFCLL